MPSRYKNLIFAIVSVATGFAVALPLGFWLRSRFADLSDDVFGFLMALLLLGIVALTMFALTRTRRPSATIKVMTPTNITPADSAWVGGYGLNFHDFFRLLSENEAQAKLTKWLEAWFGYQISRQGVETLIHTADGRLVELRALHTRIQADPEKQRSIYGLAMDLWR
jgi:hypothetical protein